MVTLPRITDTFGTIMASANELNRLCRCRANPIPLYYYNVFMGTRGAGFMATMTLFEILCICMSIYGNNCLITSILLPVRDPLYMHFAQP
jgi:hypothetical protein